jgi:hypothetical protein
MEGGCLDINISEGWLSLGMQLIRSVCHFQAFVAQDQDLLTAAKVTISVGLGANAAIESATVLENALRKALEAHPEGLDLRTIDESFTQMQAERKTSAKSLDIASSVITRTHAWATPTLKFVSRYLVKYFRGEDFDWDGQNDIQSRVARLDFLPDPDRGAIPAVYSPRNPEERSKVASLAVYSLPVLALVGYQLCVSNWIGNEAAQIIGRAAGEEAFLIWAGIQGSWDSDSARSLFATSLSFFCYLIINQIPDRDSLLPK